MSLEHLQTLFTAWKAGHLSEQEVYARWATLAVPTVQAESVLVDLDRRNRCGFAEVVYGPGKTCEQIVAVFQTQRSAGQPSLATRISPAQAAAVLMAFPEAVYNELAGTVRLGRHEVDSQSRGYVAVLTAGSGDRPVAEEAMETARWMGCEGHLILDVGVAGPHRLVEKLPQLAPADAIVVAAGMEGALPSVVAGCVSVAVIGVPTSVGYGANFNGMSALLSMLNSCAANVCVVNIDAGFKAGYLAGLIATRKKKAQE